MPSGCVPVAARASLPFFLHCFELASESFNKKQELLRQLIFRHNSGASDPSRESGRS
ncbi:hypothetical protein PAMP_022783 [Pampus punctatissimus]